MARIDKMLISPIGSAFSVAGRFLGANQQTQDALLGTVGALEQLAGATTGVYKQTLTARAPVASRLANKPRGLPDPFSPLSQPGGLSATEGWQVRRADGRLSEPTHPLAKHGSDVSDRYIRNRVILELHNTGRAGLRTAFNDRAQMEVAIAETLAARRQDINAWLGSSPRAGVPHAFEWNPGLGNLGRGFEIATPGGPIVPITRTMPNVNLILIPDGYGGYLVHSAHPKP